MLVLLLFVLQLLFLFLISRFIIYLLTKFLQEGLRYHAPVIWLVASIFFLGTLLHELAHALVAFLLRVPVHDMTLTPKVSGTKLRLGSVTISKTDPLRKMMIGVSPILCGIAIIGISLWYITSASFTHTWVSYVVVVFIIFQVSNTMFSSKKDLEGTGGFFFASIFGLILLVLLGVQLPPFETTPIYDLLVVSNQFLAVALLLDSSLLVLLSVLSFLQHR